MKLRHYLLVCTLLVLWVAGPSLRAQKADSKPNSAIVLNNPAGQWKLLGGKLTTSRNMPDLRLWDSFVVDEHSCAIGTGGSLVVLLGGNTCSYVCDHPVIDQACKSLNHDAASCVWHIVPCATPGEKASFSEAVAQLAHGLSAAVGPLLQESPARYITPVARGLESEIADSVVPLHADRVDLAPALQEMDPGTYRLRINPLPVSGETSLPVQVQWSGSGAATTMVAGVKPGLYRLVRLNPNGETAAGDAWILLSVPDRFPKDSAAFRAAVEATKKWPDGVDARAPRAILRAYLDSLSREAQKER